MLQSKTTFKNNFLALLNDITIKLPQFFTQQAATINLWMCILDIWVLSALYTRQDERKDGTQSTEIIYKIIFRFGGQQWQFNRTFVPEPQAKCSVTK